MGRIVLVTGGSRSGKSAYAQQRAEQNSGKKLYIATCPRVDDELDGRIKRHIEEREGKGWNTIEEQLALETIICQSTQYPTILVDCLTLWINNLLYHDSLSGLGINESHIEKLAKALITKCRENVEDVFFVTNEVGSGIVPESADTRLYRDLVGRCNQVIAQLADEVVLVSCGIPLRLKNNN